MMNFLRRSWFRPQPKRRLTAARPRTVNLRVEELEPRDAPAIDTVTNLMDGAAVAGSLRAVLSSAASGDTIVFQSGLTGTLTLTNGALMITQAVTIQGPGASSISISGNNASQIFVDTAAAGTSATISGLTLTGGGTGTNGGAVYDMTSTLTLSNVTIVNSSALAVGGAAAVAGTGTLNVLNSNINNNTSGTSGGGLAALGTSTLMIQNSTITRNTAVAGKGGGGVYSINAATAPTVTIQNSTISANFATGGTGGGTWTGGNLTIQDSTVSGNATETTGKAGGGILIFNTSPTVLIQNSTIYGNTTTGAGNGGGIAIVTGGVPPVVTIQNSTIADNISPTGTGGGISTGSGAATLQSTIVAENLANSAANDISNVGGTLNVSNSLLSTTVTGTNGLNGTNTANQIGVNPLLGPLQNNGGPTLTMALLPGSPALAKGSNPANLTTDQRGTGFARTVNGMTDIGAYETQGGNSIYVVGADAGGGPEVAVYNAATNAFITAFFAFAPSFTGGVRVAVDDVNGDGIPDIICAAGPGGGPQVTIYDGSKLGTVQANGTLPASAVIASFFAFLPGFTGGVYVAAATSASGQNWVAVSPGPTGSPQVVIWTTKAILAGQAANTAPTPLFSYFAYLPTFSGGLNVALGDVNGDGKLDVITGAGPGGGPQVLVTDGSKLGNIPTSGILPASDILSSFYAFLPGFTGGVYVSGGVFNGQFDVIVGAGPGGGPQVIVVNGSMISSTASNGTINTSAQVGSFFALASSFTGGVRVGYNGEFATSSSNTTVPVVLTGAGPGTVGPAVNIFGGNPFQNLSSFFALPLGFSGGLFIAG